MSLVEPASDATAYLSKPNIVHPLSQYSGAQQQARITADETAARTEVANRRGVASVTGGSIKKGSG